MENETELLRTIKMMLPFRHHLCTYDNRLVFQVFLKNNYIQ